MPRRAKIQRKTSETAIDLSLDIDGKGERRIATPVPFFNHMLEAVAKQDPGALVFGTDIPSTRAERAFDASDIALVENVLGPELAGKAFWDNPVALYRVKVG